MSQLKSTFISNRDATPAVISNPVLGPALLKEAEGYVTTGATDAAGTIYTLVSVPSNCRVSSIVLQNAALGGSSAVNCGVYAPTLSVPALVAQGYAAGAAINASFFAAAESTVSANGPTEIINQSGSNTIDKQEMPLWQALGLSSDPACMLDIALTVSTVLASSGKIGIKAKFVE